jgi:hypothetical protein
VAGKARESALIVTGGCDQSNAQDQRQEVPIAERRILLTCTLHLDAGPRSIVIGLTLS